MLGLDSRSILSFRSSRLVRRVALGAVVLAIAVGCHRGPRIVTGTPMADGSMVVFTPPQTSMIVSSSADATALREALGRALAARGYVLESDEGQRMTARLTARRVTMSIAIDYAPGSVVISYVDSNGVPVETATSSRRYDGWMRELRETIESEIGRPERERQEAIAQQERQAREAQEHAEQAARDERLEHERLAAARASAEADTARARAAEADAQARRAEAQAHPRIEGSAQVTVGRLGFDAAQARSASDTLTLSAGRGPEPMTASGVAGGSMSRSHLGFPDACPGWFSEAQHTLVLQTDMPYLRVEAPSDGDTTLAIVAPDGAVWCDDDGAGNLTPRLEGWWPAGVYRVYVGSYQRGSRASYTLVMSQRQAQPAAVYADAQPQPQPQVVETEQCTNLWAMEWLTVTAGQYGSADYQALTQREQVACSGVEAGATEYWGNGVTFRSGSTWYYPNGVTAISGDTFYYPNGVTAMSGSTLYYPNGVTALSGSQYYDTRGTTSSESGLLTLAASGLTRERYAELSQRRSSATTTFWRNMYLLVMVSEASR